MTITPRVIAMLLILRRYKFVTTAQLRRWCVPNDKDGSVTREVLRKMQTAGLARRFRAEMHVPLVTPSLPIWTPTEAGCSLLATKTGNACHVLDAMPNTNNWMQFAHFVAVSEVVHTIEEAFSAQSYAQLGQVYFEHDVISAEKEPDKRFRLYTITSQSEKKRTVCVPDFAIEVIVNQYRRVYYGELERGTDTPRRVAAKKTPGYFGMQNHFRKHYPKAQDWRVLFIWPNAGLRDAARNAVDPDKTEMWLFAALPEITPKFMHEPVIYTAKEGPRPFIKPLPTPAATPQPCNSAE
jgi:Replication-relaxation